MVQFSTARGHSAEKGECLSEKILLLKYKLHCFSVMQKTTWVCVLLPIVYKRIISNMQFLQCPERSFYKSHIHKYIFFFPMFRLHFLNTVHSCRCAAILCANWLCVTHALQENNGHVYLA